MTCRSHVFPFTAIVGQENMKKALILNAISFNLGGVLIRGHKGTAKSIAARGLAHLLPEIEVIKGCPFNCNPTVASQMCERCLERVQQGKKVSSVKRKMKVVDLPIGATEDKVVGTLDIEQAIKTGKKIFEPGLLAEAHRGILYVDEVNLLDDHIVDILLDSAAMGINVVEREGISYAHPAHFILVGTMNPEEGELRPQLLDRFGLCVNVEGLPDAQARVEIIRRRVAFESTSDEFMSRWQGEQKQLQARILKARTLLPQVTYDETMLDLAAHIAMEMVVQGHRADIAMIKTAQTIAAYHERNRVLEDDIREAAELVLPHRMRKKPFQEPTVDKEKIQQAINKKKTPPQPPEQSRPQPPQHNDDQTNKASSPDASKEVVFETGQPFLLRHLPGPKERHVKNGSGRRTNIETNNQSGYYVKSKIPEKMKMNDVAIDATLRAAAPYQKERGKEPGVSISVRSQDIRQKVREKKVGNIILFVVDASGSMGANKRMVETKGAIMSLLMDAYQKRDRVGLVAFRGNSAEVLLAPTSSLDLAKRQLEELPTGGKTPLAQGLMTAFNILQGEERKNPDAAILLVLITDGKPNVSMGKTDPFPEARQIASDIRSKGIRSIVIDSENNFIHLGRSGEIAEALGAQYYKIEDIKAGNIVDLITGSLC